MVVRLSALRTSRLYPQQIHLVIIFVRGWVNPRATVRPVGLFIHSVFSLTTGPKPPPKRFLHIVQSRASSFKWEYPLSSLRSSSSFVRLLPRLLVTSISPFIFPSITCFRRQFLHKMWPIQLAFRCLISCRIFLSSLTLSNTSSFLRKDDVIEKFQWHHRESNPRPAGFERSALTTTPPRAP